MYLKSLVLKGFKSFADRSVLSLEPGMTVIVGPNGSGKSNVSDAILWVLGEQSAKHLRGQAMEDVIFSGSSARQAVGVAEVDLILDNSDGTLPLEFEDVAITRRMYRSGESEYFINGSPSRLMDIQDILHDSGIGRDAHSIISQGSLASVLQSRAEDRRVLIEEAAGILKHKKRKEKASRRLAAMDVHLTRVKDLAINMDKSLKPLERQVVKAKQYAALEAELKDLTLQLAVDDLRGLQGIWSEVDKRDKEADAEIEVLRYKYTEAERELEKLQKTLEEKGLFVGDLAEQRRRCQSIVEKLDSNMLLLEEKGRNMVERTSDLRGKIYRSQSRMAEARAEHATLLRSREEYETTIATLTKGLSELNRKSEMLRKARTKSDEEYSKLSAELRAKQRAADDCRLAVEKSRNALSSCKLEDEMLLRRFKEIDEQFSQSQGMLAERRAKLGEVEKQLEKTRRESELAKLDIDKRVRLLESHRGELNQQREAHAAIRAEIKGLEEVDRAFESASPALTWVLTHEEEFKGKIHPISEIFKAPPEYEQLVERLLGADLFGLVMDDVESASLLANRLLEDTRGEGEISLLPVAGGKRRKQVRAKRGERLIDKLTYDSAMETSAEILLGDVYLVNSISEALDAVRVDETGSRFVTANGAVIWPSGKITLGMQVNDVEGVLSRRRRLDSLQEELVDATATLADVELIVSEAEAALNLAQQDDFDLSQTLAMLQGENDSLREEVGRVEQSMTRMSSERSSIERQRNEAAKKSAAAQPLIEEQELRIAKIAQEIAALEETIAAGSDERKARMDSEAEVRDAISSHKVDLSVATNNQLHARQRLSSLENELAELEENISTSLATQRSLDRVTGRVQPLYDTFAELTSGVKEWANKLREQASYMQTDSQSLAGFIDDARTAVRNTKTDLDNRIAAMSDIRVEKGKIETQVEVAIKAIVEDNGVLLEKALEVPLLEDRNAAEDQVMRLKRKMSNIGLVNQVAMQEYDSLKKRYDFIASQVEDLEGARKALSKIVSAIDRKMRNQFLETFETVDANFQEVFGRLFPGGNAHLSLTEPDSPETTGVEIHAQPVGKKITKTSLMSGGEKSLTALALLFAVYFTRDCPFYLLDEVEADLDDTNLRRLVTFLDSLRGKTQFILISHQRRTMEMADVLYGVSMQADGVSKVVSQKLERAIAENASDATPEDRQAAIDVAGSIVRAVDPARAVSSRKPAVVRGTGTSSGKK